MVSVSMKNKKDRNEDGGWMIRGNRKGILEQKEDVDAIMHANCH